MEHSGAAPAEREWADGRARFVDAQAGAGRAGDRVDDTGALARELASLTGALLSAGSVADVLARVVDATCRVVPAADLVSVTLRADDGSFHTPMETAPAASRIDEAQYRSGRGPCVDAARLDGPAFAAVDDLRRDDRWPEFAGASVADGYLSVLATSLIPDAQPPQLPGALNVWSRAAGGFARVDRDRMLLLATHASLALATCTVVSASELRDEQLRRAIASRDVIGQAKGILMSRRGLTADEAFDVLRRTSQDLNVKLVELAGTVTRHPGALDDDQHSR